MASQAEKDAFEEAEKKRKAQEEEVRERNNWFIRIFRQA